MFIGHIGVGLSLKKLDRTVNVGWLIGVAFLLDILLWLFVLIKVEGVRVPEDYSSRHYLYFDFPYSHSLVASVGWSGLVFLIARMISKSTGKAFVLSLAVFSHFLLDALVHPAQLPLLGEDSAKIGMGLWNYLYLELIIEVLLLSFGFWVYSKTASIRNRSRWILGVILLLVSAMTIGGQLAGPAPEPASQVPISSFSLILLLTFIFLYFDKKTSST